MTTFVPKLLPNYLFQDTIVLGGPWPPLLMVYIVPKLLPNYLFHDTIVLGGPCPPLMIVYIVPTLLPTYFFHVPNNCLFIYSNLNII